MDNRKILHIITGLGDGGAEAVLYRLCVSDKINEHVVVSMMGPGKYGPLLDDIGVEVISLNMPQGSLTFFGVKKLWNFLRAEKKYSKINNKYLTVQTWMYHGDLIGGLLAKLAGVKHVVWGIHHTVLEKNKTKKSTQWIAKVNSKLSHWVPDVIVCCAEKSRIVHEKQGYDSRKMKVIPNGYDLQKFMPDSFGAEYLKHEWNLKGDQILLGMVSRFDPQKNHENLIDALAILKSSGMEFKCIMVGGGMDPDNTYIDDLIKKNKIEDDVILLGRRDDIPAVMSALDIHILSSSAEAFPNVLAEAMACQTPCISTDVGDAALIVGDTGWVVPSEDSNALAAAIILGIQARAEKDSWENRCVSARLRVSNNFSLQKMLESYQAVWRKG